MRFFTEEWFDAALSDNDFRDRFAEYHAYLDSNRAILPKTALDFAARYTLHDARLRRIAVDGESISLVVAAIDLDDRRCWDLDLLYSGARFLEHPRKVRRGPRGRCAEFLYGEFTVAEDGMFEHGLLMFERGYLHIRFRDFRFSARRIHNRRQRKGEPMLTVRP